MWSRSTWLLQFLLLVGVAGCAPTETGNPPSEGRLLLGATSSDPEAIAVSPELGTVTVDSLWQGVLSAGYARCDGEEVYLFEQPRAVELVQGRGASAVENVPPGTYCMVLMWLGAIPGERGVPVELETYAFLMTGTRSDGLRFEVVGDNLALETPFSPMLEHGPATPPLLLDLDVARLYPTLGVESGVPNAEGVVRVDKSLTGDPGNFRADWRAAFTLHVDENRNGRVDAGELELF